MIQNNFQNFVQFLQLQTKEVSDSTTKWINVANEAGVNVDKQIRNIQQTIDDAPVFLTIPSQFEIQISMIQQIVVRSLYCNQIIRKIIKAAIAEKLPRIRQISNNQTLIGIYEERLNELVPVKICLDKIPVVEKLFFETMEILLLMEKEIKNDNNGIRGNFSDKCG